MENNFYLNTWISMVHAKDAISKVRQREMRQYHISPEQTGILAILYAASKSLSPAQLSRYLIRDPSSVSIILNRMVAKGLVTKAQDEFRKNVIRVSLTEKGKGIYTQVLKDMCIYRILGSLPDEECQRFKTTLDALLDFANQELKK